MPRYGPAVGGFRFDFYVLSASPVEVIQSALEGLVPEDHIFGTEFKYKARVRLKAWCEPTAGYGKVTRLDQLEEQLGIPADRIVYVGDGSSDIHVMLQVNRATSFTGAVSESELVAQIAKRTVWATTRWQRWFPFWKKLRVSGEQIAIVRFVRISDSGMGPRTD